MQARKFLSRRTESTAKGKFFAASKKILKNFLTGVDNS